MSSLVVGGVTIPVAFSSPSGSLSEAVDRASAFDNTYRVSQTGGTRRDWSVATKPVLKATSDTYRAQLGIVGAQLCSGDIISTPTMCCAELTGFTPLSIQGVPYEVLTFTLHEVQSAHVLLRYAPGDTITGESFTRSTIGYQINAAGAPVSIAIDTKRDGHYIGGVRSLLLEDARTNPLVAPTDFNNAAWVKVTMTVGTGIADPAGGTNAQTLTATAGAAQVSQVLGAGSSLVRADSVWVRRRTGTGTVSVLRPDNSGWTACTLTGSYQRFSVPGAASTARVSGIQITTNGDAVDAYWGQIDDSSFSTSQTTTRGADLYSLPFTPLPSESTFYLKFVEMGTIKTALAPLFNVSNAAGAAASFATYAPSGFYIANHNPAGFSSSSTLAAAPVVGDTVEILARLFGDGSVDITQSINGAAATSGPQSGAAALASAWSGQLLYLNSFGTAALARGYIAIQSLKVIAGSRSLVEMRTL